MSYPLHRSPPCRAEHVGSFLRPEGLLQVRHAFGIHKASEVQLRNAEDQAVNNIVKVQKECGFHVINDGEYRRQLFFGEFWPNVGGMTEIWDPSPDIFRLYSPDVPLFFEYQKVRPVGTAVCTGKITYSPAASKAHIEQIQYLQQILPKEDHHLIKLTIPAPSWFHFRYREGSAYPRDVYESDDKFFDDVVELYQTELQVLYDHGLRNVQIDDPTLCYFCNSKMVEDFNNDKYNTCTADELFAKYVEVYNQIMTKCPEGMHVGVHLCRGNFAGSRHLTEGAYDRIAEQLLKHLDIHTFYLEYDTERSGGLAPLQHLSRNKNVVLGLVSSKYPELEDLDKCVARVYEAAKWIAKGTGQTEKEALNQLSVSPQCGFASVSTGNAIAWTDMLAKMKLVRQIADRIWPGEP